MSQTLLEYKLPKKQRAHDILGNSMAMEVPKRKPRNSRRSAEVRGQYMNGRRGDEGDNPSSSYVRFSENSNGYCRPKKEKHHFESKIGKNIFIDSYYPKLKGDYSEDCDSSRKSQSSSIETNCSEIPPEIVGVNKPQQICRLTFDSYTSSLNSNETGRGSFESRNSEEEKNTSEEQYNCLNEEPRNVKNEKPKTQKKEESSKDSIKSENRNIETLSTVDCFAQLYKRIETLEKILQQILENSIKQKRKCKFSEKQKKGRKPQLSKTKFSASDTSETTCKKADDFGMGETSNASNDFNEAEEKDVTATDLELQNIKKALKALEKKLKNTKSANKQRSKQTNELPMTNENSESKTSKVKKNFCRKSYNLIEKGDSRSPVISDRNYFLPREMLLISTKSQLLSDKESSEWNLKNEVKKRKKKSNQKRVKRKYSSVLCYQKSRKSDLKILKKSYEIDNKDPKTDKTSITFSTQIDDKTKNGTAIFCVKYPYQWKQKAHPQSRYLRNVKRKGKDLCKKNSLMNFLGQGEGELKQENTELQNEANDTSTSIDCDVSSTSDVDKDEKNQIPELNENVWTRDSLMNEAVSSSSSPFGMTLTYPICPHSNCEECSQWKRNFSASNAKVLKKPSPFQNPLKIIKLGGKLRIPVLFEEICKTLKPKTKFSENSKVSLKYVLVERDSKHPYKTFVRRLSSKKDPDKAGQYFFGISKCCCEHRVIQKYIANHKENDKKELGESLKSDLEDKKQ